MKKYEKRIDIFKVLSFEKISSSFSFIHLNLNLSIKGKESRQTRIALETQGLCTIRNSFLLQMYKNKN